MKDFGKNDFPSSFCHKYELTIGCLSHFQPLLHSIIFYNIPRLKLKLCTNTVHHALFIPWIFAILDNIFAVLDKIP